MFSYLRANFKYKDFKFTYVFPQTLHTFFDVSVLESGLEG